MNKRHLRLLVIDMLRNTLPYESVYNDPTDIVCKEYHKIKDKDVEKFADKIIKLVLKEASQ